MVCPFNTNMPNAPKRFVQPGFVESQRKARLQQQRQYDRQRGSYRQRGYDATWDRLKEYLNQQPEFAFCNGIEEDCGQSRFAIDHIEKMQGPNDPRFFLVENLQPLCRGCHAKKGILFDRVFGKQPITGERAARVMKRMIDLAQDRAKLIESRGI